MILPRRVGRVEQLHSSDRVIRGSSYQERCEKPTKGIQ